MSKIIPNWKLRNNGRLRSPESKFLALFRVRVNLPYRNVKGAHIVEAFCVHFVSCFVSMQV